MFASASFAALVFLAMPARARAETTNNTNAPNLTKLGLATFATTYGYAALLGGAAYRMEDDSVATKMFIPVAGPYLLLKDTRFDGDSLVAARLVRGMDCDNYCAQALLAIPVAIFELGMFVVGPLAQATGIVVAFVGAAKDPPKDIPSIDEARRSPPPRTEPKVSVKPTMMAGGGAGVSLSITEW